MGNIKNLKNVNLDNHILFAAVMSDENVCKQFLENLLNIKIKELQIVHYERDIIIDLEAKDIRLDIYVKDELDNMYDIELQNTKHALREYLPKRVRYYQSALDIMELKKGQPFTKLTDSYVIFICTFDEFGLKLPRYTFDAVRCAESSETILPTGKKVVILNTKAADKEQSPEIRGFMKYIEKSTAEVVAANDTAFLEDVHRLCEDIKKGAGGNVMRLMDSIEAEKQIAVENAQIETREITEQETKEEIAKAFKENGADIELIAKSTGLTPEEIEAL